MASAHDPGPGEGASPGYSEGETALQIEALSVSLSGRPVLREVSFSIQAGEIVGLIGMNGAGKTTLLRAILGLQPVSSGEVHLPGGRRSIGYVPQKVLLDPDLPIRARDLVELGIDGGRLGIPLRSRAKRARVEELLVSVDGAALLDARIGTLSGGEQQKVLIAHALARQPRLLLLDEPLANLDLRSTQETVSLLGRIALDHGVAILLSTHDVNPLLPVLSRITYLAAGRAATGTPDEVVRSDVLSRLYGHHVDVFHAHGRVIVSVGAEHREQGCELGPEEECGPDHGAQGDPGAERDRGAGRDRGAERDRGAQRGESQFAPDAGPQARQ